MVDHVAYTVADFNGWFEGLTVGPVGSPAGRANALHGRISLSNAIVLVSPSPQETGMQSVLIAAIEDRRMVSFWYDPGVRVVEPHALGYGSDGQLLLRAFQVEGASASNQSFNWKLFRLDRMRDARFNGRSFSAPRPDYKRADPVMKRGIIAQL